MASSQREIRRTTIIDVIRPLTVTRKTGDLPELASPCRHLRKANDANLLMLKEKDTATAAPEDTAKHTPMMAHYRRVTFFPL